MIRLLALIAILLIPFSAAESRTWSVSKTGSGDFYKIQDAVNAAASGDTIFVGSGRFNDISEIDCPSGGSAIARVKILQSEITIIGDPIRKTVIGPLEQWDPSQGNQVGIQAYHPCGADVVRIHNIEFENLSCAILAEYGTRLVTNGCSFSSNQAAISTDFNELEVTNSQFQANDISSDFIGTFLGGANRVITILNCDFSGGENPYGFSHFSGGASDSVIIANCIFSTGSAGVIPVFGKVTIKGCSFSNLTKAIEFQGGDCSIMECSFSTVDFGIDDFSYDEFRIEVLDSDFSDIGISCFRYQAHTSGKITNCLLEKGVTFVVSFYSGQFLNKSEAVSGQDPHHFDMTENWWGTVSPDSIQSWIEDGEDYPDLNFYVDWFPFKSEAVSSTKEALGDVKSKYHGSGR